MNENHFNLLNSACPEDLRKDFQVMKENRLRYRKENPFTLDDYLHFLRTFQRFCNNPSRPFKKIQGSHIKL